MPLPLLLERPQREGFRDERKERWLAVAFLPENKVCHKHFVIVYILLRSTKINNYIPRPCVLVVRLANI